MAKPRKIGMIKKQIVYYCTASRNGKHWVAQEWIKRQIEQDNQVCVIRKKGKYIWKKSK